MGSTSGRRLNFYFVFLVKVYSLGFLSPIGSIFHPATLALLVSLSPLTAPHSILHLQFLLKFSNLSHHQYEYQFFQSP
jgi:hypothetical protein